MRALFVAWILSMMVAVSPPQQARYEPEAQETEEQALQRYQEIAEAVVDTSFDPAVHPAFEGEYARAQTAMMVVAVFHGESGFRKDIDLGTSRERLRKAGLNDFGRSWCMGQIHLGYMRTPDPMNPTRYVVSSPLRTPEGWTGPELLQDRRKCVASTIRVIRSSLGTCRHLPPTERLALYVSGRCDSRDGRSVSRSRMSTFFMGLSKDRPLIKDDAVLTDAEMASN